MAEEVPHHVELEAGDTRKQINGHDYRLVYREDLNRLEWEHIRNRIPDEVRLVDGRFTVVRGRLLPCTCDGRKE